MECGNVLDVKHHHYCRTVVVEAVCTGLPLEVMLSSAPHSSLNISQWMPSTTEGGHIQYLDLGDSKDCATSKAVIFKEKYSCQDLTPQ